MNYLVVKAIHESAVALSLAGFISRGAASLCNAQWVKGRLARTLPHVVDTVLLAAGISLAWRLGLNPVEHPWLLAKIIGLLLYIGLGSMVIRPGRSLWVRTTAWLMALGVFAYIVSVAVTKNPAGLFSFL